jgi:hypothetical protein
VQNAENNQSEAKEEEAKEEPNDEILTIGDTVKFNDLYVTVKSVRRYVGDPDKWEEPDRDDFLIFDVDDSLYLKFVFEQELSSGQEIWKV